MELLGNPPDVKELLEYVEKDKFPPENQTGNIEYKSSLTFINDKKINRLITQMKWRLSQGYDLYGENIAWYIIGIYDNGDFADISINESEETIKILSMVSEKCNAYLDKIFIYKYHNRSIHFIKIISSEVSDFYPLI